MNREIKFRAWVKSYEQMIILESAQGKYDFEDGFVQSFVVDGYKNFSAHERRDVQNEDIFLMQYTGLKDKNGTDIYEGDICKTYNIDEPSDLIDTVVFDDGSFVFQNDYKLSAELRGFKTDYIEVIGNIFEHPNLITH